MNLSLAVVVDGVNFYTQEGVRALFGLVVRVVGKVFSLIFLCWQFEKGGKGTIQQLR